MRVRMGPAGANIVSLRVGRLRPGRVPHSTDDFGDDPTIGVTLKRRGKRGRGIYLGCHGGIWIVGVTKAGGTEFSKTEVFSSWDDMRREWRVDEGSYDD